MRIFLVVLLSISLFSCKKEIIPTYTIIGWDDNGLGKYSSIKKRYSPINTEFTLRVFLIKKGNVDNQIYYTKTQMGRLFEIDDRIGEEISENELNNRNIYTILEVYNKLHK